MNVPALGRVPRLRQHRAVDGAAYSARHKNKER
jgi:hypothetical protein